LENLHLKFPAAQTVFIDDDTVDLKNDVSDLIANFLQSRKSGWASIVSAKIEGSFTDTDILKFRSHGVKVESKGTLLTFVLTGNQKVN